MSNQYILRQPIDILVVDDSDIDVEAVKRAFKKANITNKMHSVSDGIEALDLLSGNRGAKLSDPCIILLDINMPRMDGISFLKELNLRSNINNNIVFMLSTSSRNDECVLAYKFKVAGYFVKENLDELVKMLNIYCAINIFPYY